MKVPTQGGRYAHDCHLKDMKLIGFARNELHYHCKECGGVLTLAYDAERWDPVFARRQSFKLTRALLEATSPGNHGTSQAAPAAPPSLDLHRFRWSDTEDAVDEVEEAEAPGAPIPLHDFLAEMVRSRGSDVLLAAGFPPSIRVYGRPEPTTLPPLRDPDLRALLERLLSPEDFERLHDEMNLDFPYEGDIPGLGRCRFACSAHLRRNGHSVVFRMVSHEAPLPPDPGLPDIQHMKRFAEEEPRPAPAPRGPIPLHEFLGELVQSRGSDLFLASGFPPALRVHGRLECTTMPPLENRDVEQLLQGILSPAEQERLAADRNVDFAYQADLPGVGRYRFRSNAFRQLYGHSVVFRMIPYEVPRLEDLGLPTLMKSFTEARNGLVLVTGPTGSGKTATLAALCRHINETRAVHIITIEDPIEYVHADQKAIVVQRQVGSSTKSFQAALRAALREDPDVIVVGELRDLETIQLAITAAETGHLVLATLHTLSAAQTVSRLINAFPAGQQWQVRTMLAESLRAVFSQQLLPKKGGIGRLPALEILINSPAVANMIREDKLHMLPGVIESGASQGMRRMDQELMRMVKEGLVDPLDALDRAHDKTEFSQRVELTARATAR